MSGFKKFYVLVGLFVLVCSSHASLTLAADAKQPPTDLVILNWSEYLDPELVAEFEKQFNANIREVYFESDDLRDDMLLETGGAGYDLAMVNGITMATYGKRKWLAPVTEEQVPNLKNIDPRWLDSFDGVRGYAAPYFWGTTGIAYRKDLVKEPMTSWMDLLRPDEYLHGKIGMVENTRDLIGMALKALGYSANSTDSKELAAAERLLMEQQPYVRNYNYVALTEDSALVTGELIATMMYNGDALMVQEFHPEIEYIVPKEGGNNWVDYLVVMKKSRHKELASKFIDFLNKPENAAQLAEFVYYATPNKAAEKLLPAEFLEDPVIYPDAAVIARSDFYRPLPMKVVRRHNLISTRVMSK